MSPYHGWSAQKLLHEQFRLLDSLQALTVELNSNAGHKLLASARQELDESYGHASLASQHRVNENELQLQDIAPETPKKAPGANNGLGEQRTAGSGSPARLRGRSREPKPPSPTSPSMPAEQIKRQPSESTLQKRQEIVAKEFPHVNRHDVSRALTEAGGHVGQARTILVLRSQFPDVRSADIVAALKKARFDPSVARSLLHIEDEGPIGEKNVPTREDAGRGLEYPWVGSRSRSATPQKYQTIAEALDNRTYTNPSTAMSADKRVLGVHASVFESSGKDAENIKRTSTAARKKLFGVYAGASVKPLRKGETIGPVEPPEKEVVDGQLQLVAGPGVTDFGFDEKALPPEPVIISRVRKSSWAARLGVSEGSQLVSLNGDDVQNMTAETYLKALDVRPIQLNFLLALEGSA